MLQDITFVLTKYETFVLAFNMLCVRILFEIFDGALEMYVKDGPKGTAET
jgi:hypothetical protein